MSRLTRDETAEPVSRDQIFRRERGQGNIHFPCSPDQEQNWQPYPVDPYSAICDNHTCIHPIDPKILPLGNPIKSHKSACPYSQCSDLNGLIFFFPLTIIGGCSIILILVQGF